MGSTCCGATVIDPGNTGEWLCWSCKEHCWIAYSQQVSVMVMDASTWRTHHHVLVNDGDQDDVESRVEERIHDTYGNDCDYMMSTDKCLEFLDHDSL